MNLKFHQVVLSLRRLKTNIKIYLKSITEISLELMLG